MRGSWPHAGGHVVPEHGGGMGGERLVRRPAEGQFGLGGEDDGQVLAEGVADEAGDDRHVAG